MLCMQGFFGLRLGVSRVIYPMQSSPVVQFGWMGLDSFHAPLHGGSIWSCGLQRVRSFLSKCNRGVGRRPKSSRLNQYISMLMLVKQQLLTAPVCLGSWSHISLQSQRNLSSQWTNTNKQNQALRRLGNVTQSESISIHFSGGRRNREEWWVIVVGHKEVMRFDWWKYINYA